MQSIQLASSPYYHKSIEKAREMIHAHIPQRVSHSDDDVAPMGCTNWYSVGKPEEGHILVASSIVFLSACRFQCLLIFGIIILCHCKGVVLANRRLDKFFCFSWIVVYTRIGAQLNVPFCGDYLGGTFVVARIFIVAICCEI